MLWIIKALYYRLVGRIFATNTTLGANARLAFELQSIFPALAECVAAIEGSWGDFRLPLIEPLEDRVRPWETYVQRTRALGSVMRGVRKRTRHASAIFWKTLDDCTDAAFQLSGNLQLAVDDQRSDEIVTANELYYRSKAAKMQFDRIEKTVRMMRAAVAYGVLGGDTGDDIGDDTGGVQIVPWSFARMAREIRSQLLLSTYTFNAGVAMMLASIIPIVVGRLMTSDPVLLFGVACFFGGMAVAFGTTFVLINISARR